MIQVFKKPGQFLSVAATTLLSAALVGCGAGIPTASTSGDLAPVVAQQPTLTSDGQTVTLFFDGNEETFTFKDFVISLILLLEPGVGVDGIKEAALALFDVTLETEDITGLNPNPITQFDFNGDGNEDIKDLCIALTALVKGVAVGSVTAADADPICQDIFNILSGFPLPPSLGETIDDLLDNVLSLGDILALGLLDDVLAELGVDLAGLSDMLGLDLDGLLETVALGDLVDSLGLLEVVDSLGLTDLIGSLGLDALLDQLGVNELVAALGVEDLLAPIADLGLLDGNLLESLLGDLDLIDQTLITDLLETLVGLDLLDTDLLEGLLGGLETQGLLDGLIGTIDDVLASLGLGGLLDGLLGDGGLLGGGLLGSEGGLLGGGVLGGGGSLL